MSCVFFKRMSCSIGNPTGLDSHDRFACQLIHINIRQRVGTTLYKINTGLKKCFDNDTIFSCHSLHHVFGSWVVVELNTKHCTFFMILQTYETYDDVNAITAACNVFRSYVQM